MVNLSLLFASAVSRSFRRLLSPISIRRCNRGCFCVRCVGTKSEVGTRTRRTGWRSRARKVLSRSGCSSIRSVVSPHSCRLKGATVRTRYCRSETRPGARFTRRLLKYWSGPRCCRVLALAKARAQRRYPQRSRPSEQRRPPPKATQLFGREAEGASGRVARSLQPAEGDAPHSLLAIRPFCFYARPIPVFQQSPKALPLLVSRCERRHKTDALSNRAF
jgi:hypothetical protein